MNDQVFKLKLQNVMTDNQYDRVIGKRKKGKKLDSTNLWKISCNQVNIFKDKQAKKNKIYNICILIDESGSMRHYGGDKIKTAIEVASFISKSFNDVNINLAIIGFNERIYIHKDFDVKLTNDLLLKMQIDIKDNSSNIYSSGNHDYDAIESGLKLLNKKKGQKILITFSDGRPACDYPKSQECGGYDQSKHNPNKIKNLILSYPSILSVGVGIIDSTVEKIYPKHIIINNLSEFKVKVLDFLKNNIKRG